MTASATVKTVVIPVTVRILEWDTEDGPVYSWRASNGAESHELFSSVEDAKYDLEGAFSS